LGQEIFPPNGPAEMSIRENNFLRQLALAGLVVAILDIWSCTPELENQARLLASQEIVT
jgi:hypothetical protein